ncbi:MAG: hypothetical protein GX220_06850 [Treponema sp.]|nr:hypothetical protein [Treponema sp.]
MVPKPLPFMRLGLANLPLILALFKFSSKDFFFLVLLKILCQAFISGTFFSYIFIFSFFSTFASSITMFFLHKFFSQKISCIGLSISGSLANNFVQIIFSKFFLFKDGIRYISPLLLTSGFITGIALGIFANIFVKKSQWFDYFINNKSFPTKNIQTEPISHNSEKKINLYLLFFVSLIVMLWFVLQKNVKIISVATVIFFIILYIKNIIKKKKPPQILPPFFLLLTVVACSLLQPFGKVLFQIGTFSITSGALFAGIRRGCIVIGTVFLSKIAISDNLKIPGKIGTLLTQIFNDFEKLSSIKKAVKTQTFFSDLDSQLLHTYLNN